MNPEIIIGPPGTGKTTTLLGMVEEELARGTAPEQMGFVSFTRRAAAEARERGVKLFGFDKKRFRWFRTIHSLCFEALNLSSGDVLQGDSLDEFADWIGIRITPKHKRSEEEMREGRYFGNERGDRLLQMENKSRLLQVPLRELYDRDDDDLSWWELERVARGLEEYKQAHHLIDFTDMLVIFAEQAWRPPLEVLFVDEAQDLSMLQWRVVEKLASGCRRAVVAGDDDQAIYEWAGAAVGHFVDMPGQVRVLGQSFRVPRRVQRLSDSVITRVRHRRAKEWAPRDVDGVVEQLYLHDVDWSGQDVMVLARNNLYLRAVRDRLHSAGYMYEFGGRRSISDKRRRQLVVWENLLRKGQPAPVEDVVRIYEDMSSGTGVARGHKQLPGFPKDAMVTMAELRARGGLLRDDVWHDALDKISAEERQYIRSCLAKRERMSAAPRIRLSTIHGSKGGEADHVVLLPDIASRTYREMMFDPEAEARVWYVATTRAKERLTVVRPSTDRHFTFRRW